MTGESPSDGARWETGVALSPNSKVRARASPRRITSRPPITLQGRPIGLSPAAPAGSGGPGRSDWPARRLRRASRRSRVMRWIISMPRAASARSGWRDKQLHREVALKTLRPELLVHGRVRSRFLQEAQITGQLEHPGIVPVYELVAAPRSGSPFYSMRFVRGGHSFRRREITIGRGGQAKMSPRPGLAAQRVCRGLQHGCLCASAA